MNSFVVVAGLFIMPPSLYLLPQRMSPSLSKQFRCVSRRLVLICHWMTHSAISISVGSKPNPENPIVCLVNHIFPLLGDGVGYDNRVCGAV